MGGATPNNSPAPRARQGAARALRAVPNFLRAINLPGPHGLGRQPGFEAPAGVLSDEPEDLPANEQDAGREQRPIAPEPLARVRVGGGNSRLGAEDRAIAASRIDPHSPDNLGVAGLVEIRELIGWQAAE